MLDSGESGSPSSVLDAVRRLASVWQEGAGPEHVHRAVAVEMAGVLALSAVDCYAEDADGRISAQRLYGDGVPPGGRFATTVPAEVRQAFATGEPVGTSRSGPDPAGAAPAPDGATLDAFYVPLLVGPRIDRVCVLRAGEGRGLSVADAQLALVLASQAASALTVLQARADASEDPLTGLLNRGVMLPRLTQEIAHAARVQRPLSVLLVDLDDFKAVNDELGHPTGDRVLRAVADALAAEIRPYDHLVRYGGDEFVLVLPAVDGAEARLVADRLRRAVSAVTDPLDRLEDGLRCTVGIAEWREGDTPEALLERADRALRARKRAGKDGWGAAGDAGAGDGGGGEGAGGPGDVGRAGGPGTAHPGTDGRRVAAGASADAAALDGLLTGGGPRYAFQPIVDLGDGRVVAFEALVRGAAGTRLEQPERILAAARAAGRLVEVDSGLREAALARAAEGGLVAPNVLFVNCEPETLSQRDALRATWPRDGAPFDSVCEITERTLVAGPAELLAAVEILRDIGWGVALDDVGADPRSLALLPFLRPDVVKLDLRVIQERPTRHLASVVSAVNAYVEESGALLLAEGIETEEHLAVAVGMGATLGQGWWFGRPGPLPAELPQPRLRIPNLPPAPRAGTLTPFEIVAARRPVREGSRALLESIAGHLERQAVALGEQAVLLSCLAGDGDTRAATRRSYRRLCERVSFVGCLTRDGALDPGPAIRGGRVGDDEEMAHEWDVVLIGARTAVAMVARRIDDGAEGEPRFEYVLTHDDELVVEAGRGLMSRIAPL